MGFKDFMGKPRSMNGSNGIGSTKSPEKEHIVDVVPNVLHNTVDAIAGTAAGYTKDILNPAWDGIKSGLNIFNPKAIKDNGGFWKNTGKSLGGLITRETTAVKNAVGGIIGGIGNIYQRGVQDNVHDILSSTTDHVPKVGPGVGNVARAMLTIPALVGKVPSFFVDQLDQGLDWANKHTARTGKAIPKNTLRV